MDIYDDVIENQRMNVNRNISKELLQGTIGYGPREVSDHLVSLRTVSRRSSITMRIMRSASERASKNSLKSASMYESHGLILIY